MIQVHSTTLTDNRVRLEPMTQDHADELREAAKDGELWNLFFTGVPRADETGAYIEAALQGRREGHMLPWVVRDIESNRVAGTTRYHDILADVDRLEIGYTWYASRFHRTHVNTCCKLLLLRHAFDDLGCEVVGLRTDNFNLRSQRAIEALGAKRDGVLRHHKRRRDGTVRDTVMYSILRSEWPSVQKHLELRIWRHSR